MIFQWEGRGLAPPCGTAGTNNPFPFVWICPICLNVRTWPRHPESRGCSISVSGLRTLCGVTRAGTVSKTAVSPSFTCRRSGELQLIRSYECIRRPRSGNLGCSNSQFPNRAIWHGLWRRMQRRHPRYQCGGDVITQYVHFEETV